MTPIPAGTAAMLPVSALLPSPTNPRMTFASESLAELAESIRQQGVIQPVLVRPLEAIPPTGEQYEVICGERRWRASKLAGLEHIPAYVRDDMTDSRVIEIQLIENLQREDLHPLEEADGYQALMRDCGAKADDIAERIGKSRAYIYASLKLLELTEPARKAFRDGLLTASTALLIARIPTKALQEQACSEITNLEYDEDVMSYREAARHIQHNYMLRLAKARFPITDETLLATAGACNQCPKRTGNQQALFADVDDADVCTDPECFAAKGKAYADHVTHEAKAEGQKVIAGKAAKEMKKTEWTSELAGDYVSLEEKCYSDPEYRTFGEILGDDKPEVALLVDPFDDTHVIQIVTKASLKEHLESKGIKIPSQNTQSKQKQENKRATDARNFRARLFERCSSHLVQSPIDRKSENAVRIIAKHALMLTGFDNQKRITRHWLGPKEKGQDDHELIREFSERIATLDYPDCMRLMLEITAINSLSVPSWLSDYETTPENLQTLADYCGIDADAFKLELAKEKSAAAKVKNQSAKSTKTKAKPSDVDTGSAAETPPDPAPAARASESLRVKKTAPAAKKTAPKPLSTKAKTKAKKDQDQAPATPSKGNANPLVRYRHPEDRALTWSGRGKKPLWIEAWLQDQTHSLTDLVVETNLEPAPSAEV